jgi:glycosyltransferase involved in cell wall biosynthesis
MKKKIVIIFLTFNSDKIISKSLKSAKKVTNDIVIVLSDTTTISFKVFLLPVNEFV